MNDVKKWTGGRSSDKGVAEVVILLTLLIFVVFGFVFYFFYQKVIELTEQVASLQQQVGELTNNPQRLENPEKGGDFQPVYIEKWAPPGSSSPVEEKTVTASDDKQERQGDSFKSAPSVTPKEVSTVSVRPDGTIVGMPKSADPNKASKKIDFAGKSTTSQSAGHKAADEMVIGDIKVRLKNCEWKELYLYCDLRIRSATEVVREIVLDNKGSFVTGKDGAVRRVSSFRVGLMGDRQNYRSTATISRSLPLDVQFSFYLPKHADFETRKVQFNIAGSAFEFDGMAFNRMTRVVTPTDQAEETQTVNRPAAGRVQTFDNILVELKHCAERQMYLYCDLNLNYLGYWERDIVISKDNSFVRTPDHASYRVTSFSFGTSGEKTHHQTKTNLRTGQSVIVRFRLYDPPSGIQEFETMQFNIDGQKVVFEDVRVGS
jgi:hypothetical protein